MSSPPSISRSFAILSAGQVASRLISFATTVYLTRTLLPEGFGIVTFAMGVLEYAALVVNAGLDFVGPVEVARGRIPVAALARTVLAVRLLLAVVGFAALAAFALAAPLPSLTVTVLLWYGLSLAATAVDLRWVFLGAESMGPPALGEVVSQAVQLAGVLLFVHGPQDVGRMPLVFLAGQGALCALVAVLFTRRFGPPGLGIDRAVLRALLPAAAPLGVGAALGVVLHNFDIVLLGLWRGTAAAGLYGAAYRVIWIPVMLMSTYLTVVRPAFARAAPRGREDAARLLAGTLRVTVGLGLGMAVGGALVAEPLFDLLFGAGFGRAVPAFQILAASLVLMLVSRPYRLLLATGHREWTDLRTLSVAAAVTVALNVALIPRLGLEGAALAALAGEVVILAGGHVAAFRLVGPVPLGGLLAKAAVAAAVMAGVLYLTRDVHVLARVAVGGAVYLATAVALRLVPLSEVRALLALRVPTTVE
jgi:O-antigen/teichoic acid export membrane protein